MNTQRFFAVLSSATVVAMALIATPANAGEGFFDGLVQRVSLAAPAAAHNESITPLPASALKSRAAKKPTARTIVEFHGYKPGMIVVKTEERRLYYVLDDNTAMSYPVGVGKAGRAWVGEVYVNGKYLKPAWVPPADVRHDNPALPDIIPGDSVSNPMGAAAITLSEGEYAIHGTNNPKSIGGYVSYGCIRMFNDDVVDLYERVGYGTKVVVLQ